MSGFAAQIMQLECAIKSLEEAYTMIDDAKAALSEVALQLTEAALLQKEYPKLMTTSDRVRQHIEHAEMLERVVRDTYPTSYHCNLNAEGELK